MANLTFRDIRLAAKNYGGKPGKAGDFDAYLKSDGKTLFIPKELFNFLLIESNVSNAQSFLDCVEDKPHAVASFLKWKIDDVEKAWIKLKIYIQQSLGKLNSVPRTRE